MGKHTIRGVESPYTRMSDVQARTRDYGRKVKRGFKRFATPHNLCAGFYGGCGCTACDARFRFKLRQWDRAAHGR